MSDRTRDEILTALTREFTDKGLLIEAGWVSLQRMAISPNVSQTQLDEMRMAFFAGAQHLFGSIMSILEPGEEPTENDMKRLDLIHNELDKFIEEVKRKIPTQGSA